MKKVLILFAMIISFSVSINAQVVLFKTTSYSHTDAKTGEWSEKQVSGLTVTIDGNNNVITIYSPNKQVYHIITDPAIAKKHGFDMSDQGKMITDDTMTPQQVLYVIDQDNAFGILRLRYSDNYISELFVDYNNIHWFYELYQIGLIK